MRISDWSSDVCSSDLIGPKRVDRGKVLRHIVAQQDRGALAFDIAEVRAVLGVADQRGQRGREAPCDLRRIDQPLQFEWLQPAETIADDDPAPGHCADISTAAVQCRPQEIGRAYCRERVCQYV